MVNPGGGKTKLGRGFSAPRAFSRDPSFPPRWRRSLSTHPTRNYLCALFFFFEPNVISALSFEPNVLRPIYLVSVFVNFVRCFCATVRDFIFCAHVSWFHPFVIFFFCANFFCFFPALLLSSFISLDCFLRFYSIIVYLLQLSTS